MFVRFAALMPLLLAAVPAMAQDQATPGTASAAAPVDPAALDGDRITLGLGAGVVPSYEGSDHMEVTAVPGVVGRVSRINFVVLGARASADLIPTPGGPGWDLQAGPLVSLNFNRHDRIDDPQVAKMGKIGLAVEAGGYVGIGKQGVITSDYDKLSVSVGYTHDVGTVHKSYTISPAMSYITPLSTKALVGLNAGADYMGQGYANTYFGVTGVQSAASGLPVYNARKGWRDWNVTMMGMVSITGDLTHGLAAVGGVSYRHLLNSAADSPVTSIAGTPNQLLGAVGIAYTF